MCLVALQSCPASRGQSKVQKGFSRSSSSSRASQQGTQQHSRSSTALAVPTSSDISLPSSFVEFQKFQQYRAFLATIQGDSTQASAMITTHSGLHSSSPTGISPTIWIFDSGSSHHMTPNISLLSHCVTPVFSISIATANDFPMSVVSIGSISSCALSISDVFYVPQLSSSLLTISQLSDSDFDVEFSSSTCVVQDQVTRK